MREKKYAEAVNLCNDMLPADLESRPQRLPLLMTRVSVQARHGRWKEAADDAAKAVAIQPDNAAYGHTLTLLLLAKGDREGARQSSQRTLDRFAPTNGPDAAARMAMDCLIIPPSGVNSEAAGKLADSAMTLASTNVAYQFCKGLAEYRLGRFDAGLNLMAQPLASTGESWDDRFHIEAWMVMAMAHWQLKQADEANSALAKGVQLAQSKLVGLDSGDLGSSWQDWIICRSLLDEATALIGNGGARTGKTN
jgi:tetratricopeptide (TPR) repeat protein